MYTERLSPYISPGGIIDETIDDERKRILNFISKPCPHNFPKELKHLWENNLEFSFTPYQSVMESTQRKKNTKTKGNFITIKSGFYFIHL